MYICQNCKNVIGPNVSSNLVVVETRDKVYPARKDDCVSTGQEIVREVRVCAQCVPAVS